jgi:hypothetical protein
LNSKGATPLHECVAKKTVDEETLKIIETLLVFKADITSIRGKSDAFKDQTVMDLAFYRFHNQNQPEAYNLIKDFLNDSSLSSATSSTPNSPLAKTVSASENHKYNSIITNALDSLSLSSISNNSQPILLSQKSESEQYISWSKLNDLNKSAHPEEKPPLTSLLWPQPQICNILSEKFEDRFLLNDARIEPFYIYVKPPNTYSYMDFINKLASSFSGKYTISKKIKKPIFFIIILKGMAFTCIHKPISSPYICVNINKTLFQQENSYSLLVSSSKVII